MASDANGSAREIFLSDVIGGLSKSRKRLEPKYFYDARGAELFNQICQLDAYYPTRTETGILDTNADDIAHYLGTDAVLVEYGAGSLDKVRILLDAISNPVALIAVDISADQLDRAANDVRSAYPKLEVLHVAADFTRPVDLPEPARVGGNPVVFFPGSTIGNFDPDDAIEFMVGARDTVGPGGMLLIGVDLKKDSARLEIAYDDPAGVTAAFNLNLLTRINRELGGDFDLDTFNHVARYNTNLGRIEMHLKSTKAQTVTINGQPFDFAEGETIHTENSYKYSIEEFQALAERAGFKPMQVWTDAENLFAVHLFKVAADTS